MPYLSNTWVRCSKCDLNHLLSWIGPRRSDAFFYKLGKEFFFEAGSAIGWCNECRQIRRIETLTTDHIADWLDRRILIREAEKVQLGWKNAFAQLKIIYQLSNEIRHLQALSRLIALRKKPKCFYCGSMSVHKILDGDDNTHPNCGGILSMECEDSDIHCDFDPKTTRRFYSVEGVFLYQDDV